MKKGKDQEREAVAKKSDLGIEDELVMKATGLGQSIIKRLKKTLPLSIQ